VPLNGSLGSNFLPNLFFFIGIALGFMWDNFKRKPGLNDLQEFTTTHLQNLFMSSRFALHCKNGPGLN
jgi:hypothetical protein